MIVCISGSSGFVGKSLESYFIKNGATVVKISRSQLQDTQELSKLIESCDLVVNLAGANIIHRWTRAYKELLYSSRIDTTNALISAMDIAKIKPKMFISTSAIGIYKSDGCHDEDSQDLGDDFLSKLCKDWEACALKASTLGIRTAIFRFGVVLGNGGALRRMITPFKLGLGGRIGSGKQHFSYIHIKDLMRAYKHTYDNISSQGIFNLTSPTPTTNLGLTKALGKALKRPTIITLPKFILRLIFSQGSVVLTSGQCAKPQKLLNSGFKFKYKDIEDTINNLVP